MAGNTTITRPPREHKYVLRRAKQMVSVNHPRQVWLITTAHGVNEFYTVALPPIIPLIVTDLQISYAEAGGLITVFFAMYSLFQLPAGRLADRIGQTRLLSVGMVGLAAGVLIASVAQDYGTLVLAQVVAGIGGSTYHPSGMSLISDVEIETTEGKAMGIHGFGGLVGTAAAPVVVGGLAVLYDWRVAIAGSAMIGLIYAGVFAILFTRPDEEAGNELPNSFPDGGRRSTIDDSGKSRDWSDLLQRLTNVPLTWWFAGLCLIQFLIAFESNAVRAFAPAYLFHRAGESTSFANAVYFVMIVGGVVSTLGGGYLADRIDRRLLGFVGLLLSAVALALLPLLPAHPSLLIGWFFVLGFVMFAALPAKNALAAGHSEREFSGSLFGIMMTAGAVGSATGPLLVGLLAERFMITMAFPMIASIGILGSLAFALLYRV